MKIAVFNRRNDEDIFWEKYKKEFGVELVSTTDVPNSETIELARGIDCISIITSPVKPVLLDKMKEIGIKFISTRTIGYDHIDIDYAKKIGIHVGNAVYSQCSVADYTVMLMLMTIRKMKVILNKQSAQDFTLIGEQGRELHNLTVGIIGTGRIGRQVIKNLSGFGCKMIAHDLYENDEVKKYAKYVDLDTILKESDIITLHMPATDSNYHMINKNAFEKMKNSAVLINTGRGALVDTDALIDALEKEQIGGAGLDVIEHETGLYYFNREGNILSNRDKALLHSFPNVILTPHTAFYTDQAVNDMVEYSLRSCVCFMNGQNNPWQVF